MENNRLNALVIQQYLEGKLDPSQMHELERQALDDPFLADAIEGYSYNRVPVDHQLSILQRQLEERIAIQQDNKNRFNFSWQRLSAAAAAGLLFITAGILFWMKYDQPKHEPDSKKVAVVLTPPVRDSKTINTAPDTIAAMPERKSLPVAASHRKRMEKDNAVSRIGAGDHPDSALRSEVEIARATNPTRDFEDFVGNQPLKKLAKDTIGKKFQSVSSFTEEPAAGERSQALSEVVVTKSRSARVGAAPANGTESYNEYLKSNLRRPEGQAEVHGKVNVEFTVGPDGTLSGFRIVRGLTDACNAEAIRLIKEGPVWVPSSLGKPEKVKVAVSF